jgi:hypothetical protein
LLFLSSLELAPSINCILFNSSELFILFLDDFSGIVSSELHLILQDLDLCSIRRLELWLGRASEELLELFHGWNVSVSEEELNVIDHTVEW